MTFLRVTTLNSLFWVLLMYVYSISLLKLLQQNTTVHQTTDIQDTDFSLFRRLGSIRSRCELFGSWWRLSWTVDGLLLIVSWNGGKRVISLFSSSYTATNLIMKAHSQDHILLYLLKVPSPNIILLRLGLQHMSFRGTQFSP